MNLEQVLKELKEVQNTASFDSGRDHARRAYHLLKHDIELPFEKTIFDGKLFDIRHSILMEDKERACRIFNKALISIMSIIKGAIDA